jgi:hypothetical protein
MNTEQITMVINTISEKLGVASNFIMSALIKQSRINGFFNIAWAVLFLLLSVTIFCLPWFFLKKKKNDAMRKVDNHNKRPYNIEHGIIEKMEDYLDDDFFYDDFFYLLIGCSLISFLFLIAIGCCIYSAYCALYNPQYYAIHTILSLINGGV